MTFSLGGVKRGLLVITAALLLSVSVSACSSEEKSPLDDKATASPTQDQKAKDKAEVTALVSRYFAAVVEAENNADPDPKPFAGIAKGGFLEYELSIVSKYKDGDIRRVGEPKISEVDVVLSGETADIQACVNEDGWSAKQKGKKIPAPKLGPKPWIAQATQTDGAWILTDVGGKDDKGKVC